MLNTKVARNSKKNKKKYLLNYFCPKADYRERMAYPSPLSLSTPCGICIPLNYPMGDFRIMFYAAQLALL